MVERRDLSKSADVPALRSCSLLVKICFHTHLAVPKNWGDLGLFKIMEGLQEIYLTGNAGIVKAAQDRIAYEK